MPKYKLKKSMQLELTESDGVSQIPCASGEIEDTESDHSQKQMKEAGLDFILKEQREFRKDNSQQLKEIREEINKTNISLEEVEKRINTAETQIQGVEEAVTELLKLQIHLDAKLTELEDRSRRENIRIHKVKEGAEEDSPSMVGYVEHLLERVWISRTPLSCEWRELTAL